MYAADSDWLFASDAVFGKMPVWAVSSLQKVVQELMRNAELSTTMEIYMHPRMERKREMQSQVVDVSALGFAPR